jgi:hypothetical protein
VSEPDRRECGESVLPEGESGDCVVNKPDDWIDPAVFGVQGICTEQNRGNVAS